jgi:hypothetical protein
MRTTDSNVLSGSHRCTSGGALSDDEFEHEKTLVATR